MEEETIDPKKKKSVATPYDNSFDDIKHLSPEQARKNVKNIENIHGSGIIRESFNTSENKDYLKGWENPHTIYGGQDVNSVDPFSEIRAINQSGFNKFSKILPRVATKVSAELLKIPGYIGGLAGGLYGEASDAITGKNEYSFTDQAFNNAWVKSISEINENINEELLPVYVKKAVKEGNLWDNITSVDFWATEGADGIGFMASMMIPGAALKALGLGNKLAKGSEALGALVSKGTQLEKIMLGAQKASKLGLNAKNFDMFNATIVNTYLESAAEAGMAMDSFEKQNKNEFIDQQLALGKTLEEANQLFNTQKAILGKNIFTSNVALLTLPNGLQSAIMFGKGANKFMSSYTTKEAIKAAGKRIVGSTLSEGFLEEASQTTVENYFKNKALKNNLKGDGLFSFDDFDPNGLKEAYLDTISSVEGQKAIFLGGVLGSSMSVIQGRKEDIYNKKESNKATSLTERYDNTLNALVNTKGSVSYDYNNNPIVSKKEIIQKFKTIDELTHRFKEYDEALESGNEEVLEKARNKTIQDVILPFAKQGELGLEALNNYYDKMLESDEVKNSEEFDIIKARKEEVINTAKETSKKYEFYNDFINKRINIPIKAETKEAKKELAQLKSMYIDRLASSYALAEMDKHQVTNKIKEVEKELNELNKIHNLNEVTTDELITEYVHNTDTTESFTNKKKEKFAESNKEYKDLLEHKNRLEEKLKKVNTEISEGFFNSEKIQNDFNFLNDIKNNEFEQQEQTEDEKLETTIQTSEVAQVEKELQNKINESIDEEGNPTISQEEFNAYMEQQDIPEEVKDAVVLLNEEQLNTLPTQEVIDNKVELIKTELEGVDEKDIIEDDSIHKEEDEDVANSFANIEVITPKIENNSSGHKIQNFFNNFINFEKQPRDKTKDKVTFSLGDFINNDTVKDIWDNFLKTGKIDKSGIKWLEEYLPIKVTLTNGKEEGSSFLKSKKGSPNFESYELPLRKAIVKALIENKGDFTKFEGSVQGQGKGKLNLDNASTQNNVLDISVLKGMKKPELLKYLKENTYIVNHDKQLVHAETGQKAVESFFNVIKSFHSGDVFLVFTRPNGQKVPIKLNNKRISNEKAGATVKLLSLLSNVIRTNQSDTILSDKNFKTFLKEKIGEESYNQLESEINLSKKNNNNERLREILEYITYSQNNNEISKLFVDNQGNLTVGRLLQKVNEDLQNEGSINYDMNLSSIGFTGFAGQNIDALINDELDTNEQARFNHLVNFIRYKKSNIIADKFKDNNYVEHVFGIDNKESLVSTNVSVDKDMFEGYSDIFLNNEVTTLEDNKTKSKELKEIENTEIPLAKEVVYKEPKKSVFEQVFGINPDTVKDIEEKNENNLENTRIIEENFVSLSKMDKITNIRDKNKMIEFAKENLDFIPKSLKTSENFQQLKQEYPNSEVLNKQVDKICGL